MRTIRLTLAAAISVCGLMLIGLCLVSLSPAADPSKAGGSREPQFVGWRAEPVAIPAPEPINVPDPVENYLGRRGRHLYGSCFHAAMQDLLRWQGLDERADYWRRHFDGPATLDDIRGIADCLALRHAETEDGNEDFLEYCTQGRLGAAIGWEVDEPGDHAIVFCGFDGREAVLLGVNRPETTRMERGEFLRRWRRCGGFAITILPPEKHR